MTGALTTSKSQDGLALVDANAMLFGHPDEQQAVIESLPPRNEDYRAFELEYPELRKRAIARSVRDDTVAKVEAELNNATIEVAKRSGLVSKQKQILLSKRLHALVVKLVAVDHGQITRFYVPEFTEVSPVLDLERRIVDEKGFKSATGIDLSTLAYHKRSFVIMMSTIYALLIHIDMATDEAESEARQEEIADIKEKLMDRLDRLLKKGVVGRLDHWANQPDVGHLYQDTGRVLWLLLGHPTRMGVDEFLEGCIRGRASDEERLSGVLDWVHKQLLEEHARAMQSRGGEQLTADDVKGDGGDMDVDMSLVKREVSDGGGGGGGGGGQPPGSDVSGAPRRDVALERGTTADETATGGRGDAGAVSWAAGPSHAAPVDENEAASLRLIEALQARPAKRTRGGSRPELLAASGSAAHVPGPASVAPSTKPRKSPARKRAVAPSRPTPASTQRALRVSGDFRQRLLEHVETSDPVTAVVHVIDEAVNEEAARFTVLKHTLEVVKRLLARSELSTAERSAVKRTCQDIAKS